MDEQELAEIEFLVDTCWPFQVEKHVRKLIAEVRRLNAEVEKANKMIEMLGGHPLTFPDNPIHRAFEIPTSGELTYIMPQSTTDGRIV